LEAKRELTKPQTGTYVVLFVKKGPDVPVRLHKIDGNFTADVFGMPQPNWLGYFYPESKTILPPSYSPDEVGELLLDCIMNGSLDRHPFARILAYGDECTQARHDQLVAQWQWAQVHAKWHPCLRPREPINLRSLPAMGDYVVGVKNGRGKRRRPATTLG
jgi:hypothetical protein